MILSVPERRNDQRIPVDGPIKYRPLESEHFMPGQIENISAGGVLIWICEPLPLGSQLGVRIELDSPDDTHTDLVATLLYQLSDDEDSLYGYGCCVELGG